MITKYQASSELEVREGGAVTAAIVADGRTPGDVRAALEGAGLARLARWLALPLLLALLAAAPAAAAPPEAVETDDEALRSRSPNGVWVQAWVYVPNEVLK